MKDIVIEDKTYNLLMYLCDELEHKNFNETIEKSLNILLREKK